MPYTFEWFLLLADVKYYLWFARAILTGTGLPEKFQVYVLRSLR
jgi:hypothetical protein